MRNVPDYLGYCALYWSADGPRGGHVDAYEKYRRIALASAVLASHMGPGAVERIVGHPPSFIRCLVDLHMGFLSPESVGLPDDCLPTVVLGLKALVDGVAPTPQLHELSVEQARAMVIREMSRLCT